MTVFVRRVWISKVDLFVKCIAISVSYEVGGWSIGGLWGCC